MSGAIASIWLAFCLNAIKDVVIYFSARNSKIRDGLLWCRKKYLIAKTPFPTFLKHYTDFIREKNEIFEILMADYQDKVPDNPIFFFPALSQYWLLKKTLIQQYEKTLNIYLIDYEYDVFEDEIRKAKTKRVKESLNKLIWKLRRIDPDFKEEFAKCEANTKFLENLIKGKREDVAQNEDEEEHIEFDITGFDQAQIAETISDFISNQNVFLSKDWGWFSSNKIKNIEKFELFTDARIIKKYVKLLKVKMKHGDSENLLRITKSLDETWTNLLTKLDSTNQYLAAKFLQSERKYAKVYYKLLIKKYINVEKKAPLEALTSSDAVLIINRSFDYQKEKERLLEEASQTNKNRDKWRIAFRLWELNEIRKHICKTYLDIDIDFSKWVASYDKLTSLANKSNVAPEYEVFKQAEEFLKKPINPVDIFELNNYFA